MQKTITNLQLRVARLVLGIGVREIGMQLGVSGAAICQWENKNIFHLSHQRSSLLIHYFHQRKIIFPAENSIAFISNLNKSNTNTTNTQLTRFQLRAARNALNLTQIELAKSIGVYTHIIEKNENLDNEEYIRSEKKDILIKIKNWFEEHNIKVNNDFSVSF